MAMSDFQWFWYSRVETSQLSNLMDYAREGAPRL